MAALVRARDWSKTALGPMSVWPVSLRTVVGMMMAAPNPMVLLWGPTGVLIYNDGYAQFAGDRHPDLLGRGHAEAWPEIADFNHDNMRRGLGGEAWSLRDQELVLDRGQGPKSAWLDLDYTPVPDESGKPAGVMVFVTETTDRLLAERHVKEEVERQRRNLQQMPGFAAILSGPEHRFDYVNDAYLEIAGGDRGFVGRTVREAFPELAGQGFFELLDQVYSTGERFVGRDLPISLARDEGERFMDLLYEPVRDDAGDVSGIFVGGYDVTEAHRTSKALIRNEERYRTLIDAMQTGFCIVRMKFDDDGRAIDYQIVEGNPAYERMTGLVDSTGKWVSEIAPGLERHWFDRYGRVALTGEQVRFDSPASIFNRWYDVQALRIGAPEDRLVAILFNDITSWRAAEARQAARVELSDALRDLTDPGEIAYTASGVLARALGVSRAGYGTVDARSETITIERDWNQPGVASIAGTLSFRDYGSYIEDLKRGLTVTIEDVTADPRTADTAEALKGISASAFINMPLVEHGETVALAFVTHAETRAWAPEDERLVRDIAERVRTGTERVRATAALKASEAQLRFLDDLTTAAQAETDPERIMAIITRMTAQHLGASACAYADMDADENGFTVRGGWAVPGWPPIVGHYKLADFGTLAVEALGAGRPLIVNDVNAELAPQEAAAYQATSVSAIVSMPLIKEGRLLALMALHHRTPHVWTPAELATIREVTTRCWAHIERVRDEAERRVSEGRYRALFDAIDEGFCIIEFVDGPRGQFDDYVHVEANAAYTDNAGIPDVVGQYIREMMPDEAEEWIDLFRQVLVTGQPVRFEKELEATARWLELAAFRIEPPERNQVAVLFKDLTSRKLAERALEDLNTSLEQRVEAALAERKLFADILQSADAFVQVVDLQGRWLAVNEAAADEFERVFGARPVMGMKMSDALSHLPEQAAAVEAIWARALREAPFIEVQEFGDPGRDRRFYEMRYYPLMDARGERIGSYQIVYDVTDRLNEQARLREAEEALRQSQKMEAVGQLTGGIAHDFNNLLAGISGSLELLNKRLGEGRLTGMERYIDAAQGAAQRATSLTQRLLAFSRRQTLDPKPTDVNRLIGGMEDLIRRSVGPDIEVEVVGAGGLWPVQIDQSQLENALLNLAINGRDAMAPHGGRLTIETANKWLDERHARERDLAPGQYVSLCVTDTGIGMAPETIEKIFDPFFTTKPLGQGTGLGLSMIHGFVRQSGGQVRVYSELGSGTTMCLYLPRFAGEVNEVDPVAAALAARGGHGETVLVIDDEPTVRMLVVEVLQEAGYTVIEAGDGPSGLRILETDARIDLLVSDVGLPGGMNGRQVADAARVGRPDLKVLFITGYAENAAVGNGLLDIGMEVMTKPFVMADLAAKVHDMMEA